MGTPKVSILVPTFNPVPEYLREALTCLQMQSERNWHAVIHDDSSETDVRSIVAPFLADPRFTFVQSKSRLGIGGNWNACLQYVKAPIIQFLFQDDTWEPAYLEKSLGVLERNASVGLVSVNHDYRCEGPVTNNAYYEDLQSFKRSQITEGRQEGREFLRFWLTHDLKPGLIGEPSFVMLRRSLVREAGLFRTDMPQGLDNEYWIRTLLLSNCFFLKEELGSFRIHARGASALNDATGSGLTDRLRIYQILLKTLPREDMLRTATKESFSRAFSGMVRRFFDRKTQGKNTSLRGGSTKTILTFAARHPLITIGALVNGITK